MEKRKAPPITDLERRLVQKYRLALSLMQARLQAAVEKAARLSDEELAAEVFAADSGAWPREAEEGSDDWLGGPLRAMGGAVRDLRTVRLVQRVERERASE